MGYYLIVRARYDEARPLRQRALALAEQSADVEPALMGASLKKLASLAEQQGNYTEAEVLYQRALALFAQHLALDHPEQAASLSDLAMVFLRQGKYAEAEPLLR